MGAVIHWQCTTFPSLLHTCHGHHIQGFLFPRWCCVSAHLSRFTLIFSFAHLFCPWLFPRVSAIVAQGLSPASPPLLLGFFTPEGTSFGTWQNGTLDLLGTKLPPYPSANGHHAKAGVPAELDTCLEQSCTAVRCTADVTLQVRDPPQPPPPLSQIAHISTHLSVQSASCTSMIFEVFCLAIPFHMFARDSSLRVTI